MRPKLLDLFAGAGGCSVGYNRAGFDVIHASPPCQRYSAATKGIRKNALDHPDLVAPVRAGLIASNVPYVIENVPQAPLISPVLLCGWALGLKHLPRHRLFESSLLLMSPGCGCPFGDSVSVFGHSGEDRRRASLAAQAHLKPRVDGRTRSVLRLADARELMGVPWMTDRSDISEAIPPAYTEYIGAQLLDQIEAAA